MSSTWMAWRSAAWAGSSEEAFGIHGGYDAGDASIAQRICCGPEAPGPLAEGAAAAPPGYHFPKDYQAVAKRRLDILVTHEAPLGGHEHGFMALDELAKSTQARLIIHGHHQRSYQHQVGSLTIKGLAKAEV